MASMGVGEGMSLTPQSDIFWGRGGPGRGVS